MKTLIRILDFVPFFGFFICLYFDTEFFYKYKPVFWGYQFITGLYGMAILLVWLGIYDWLSKVMIS